MLQDESNMTKKVASFSRTSLSLCNPNACRLLPVLTPMEPKRPKI